MPIEKWSEQVSVVHLADDPQFTDDMETLSPIQVLSQPCAPRGIFQLHVIATGPETPCA